MRHSYAALQARDRLEVGAAIPLRRPAACEMRGQQSDLPAIRIRPMPQRPESILEGKQRPFTGAEFLESLRDGREVYIYGDRVKDVTTHPAFRNAAASVAQLYDALHDGKSREVLTAPTDTG